MTFQLEVSLEFHEDYRKRCAKNNALRQAVDAKVKQIQQALETNPDHYKPLRGPLSGLRRVHIADAFVLIFEVLEESKTLRLLKLAHDDEANRK